ncbi:MAG: hypothetical protein JNK02_09000 [Planctomycetes bacterium]|nr:hypothetical protein [Planctomycetota bacterium]
MKTHFLFAAAMTAALSTTSRAQLVVGNDQSGSATIYEVDVSTGTATPLYASTTNEAKPWGMAYDASTNTLYWNNGSNLYSSPYGNPLVPTLLGGMTFNAATINFVALSFANGKLYGTRNIATEAVYEIDPVTRIATQIYVHPSTFDFGGLEHDASTGDLYGLSDTAPAPDVRGLYRIDPVAQTTTFVAPYPAGETDIDGLAVANGRAYYVTDGPNTTQASFYVFDVASGTQIGTLPSPFTGSGTFCAATWVGNSAPTTPATPFCFGDGAGAACPCANNGAPGNGCASSVNVNGANLAGSGLASIANDSFLLSGTGMPNSSALYFQGTSQLGGGLGVAFGDGLRCAGGSIIRLGTKNNVAGASQYPELGDTLISIRGFNAAGDVRTYQVWYRNAAAFCTPSTFNLSNGTSVTWIP